MGSAVEIQLFNAEFVVDSSNVIQLSCPDGDLGQVLVICQLFTLTGLKSYVVYSFVVGVCHGSNRVHKVYCIVFLS